MAERGYGKAYTNIHHKTNEKSLLITKWKETVSFYMAGTALLSMLHMY